MKKYIRQKYSYLFFLFSATLHADQFSFLFYNDVFSGTDKHFTNGLNFSWIDDSYGTREETKSNSYNNFVFSIVDSIPYVELDSTKNHNAGISLSQIMITPNDISVPEPQYNDIPYAGYLALAFYKFEWDKDSFKEFRMEFGVVGKESGAEFVQKGVHVVISSNEPKGWDNQLGTQYTAIDSDNQQWTMNVNVEGSITASSEAIPTCSVTGTMTSELDSTVPTIVFTLSGCGNDGKEYAVAMNEDIDANTFAINILNSTDTSSSFWFNK